MDKDQGSGFNLKSLIFKPLDISEKLDRSLGLYGLIAISLSATLGSTLFVIPALGADILAESGGTGAGLWLAFIAAGLIVLPSALSKAELGTAMPSSGGSYVYIRQTYGAWMGMISGLGLWASFGLKSAFALIGFSAYIYAVQGSLGFELTENISKIIAIFLLTIIVLINIMGVKSIKRIQFPVVSISVLFVLLLAVLAAMDPSFEWSKPIQGDAFSEDGLFSRKGAIGIGSATAFVFLSFAGVTKIAAVAGEIKSPSENLPKSMIWTLIISTLVYVVISFFLFGLMDPSQLGIGSEKPDKAPIHTFAVEVGGTYLGLLAAGVAIVSMAGMALSGVLGSSRFIFAMSRDNLLPQWFEDLNPRFETPHYAIIVTGAAMAIAILTIPVGDVAKLASGFKIMIFMLINSTVIVLRRLPDGETWYTPSFKSPMFPAMQIFGIISGFFLLVLMGTSALIGAVAAIGVGSGIYLSYSRKKVEKSVTPWRIIQSKIFNQERYEVKKWWLVFNACAHSKHPDHLTLKEFIKALGVLEPSIEPFHARVLFHEIDSDGDGMIDIEEFVGSMSDGKYESE
jgi:amino acid transporter|tara:strand:- start:1614 stop:3320 length:1707 start_codon:yes stop_codon:yes gene_type:complete